MGIVLMALAACGDRGSADSAASAQTGPPAPQAAAATTTGADCRLLTRAEAADALGVPVQAPEVSGYPGVSECKFKSVDQTMPRLLQIRIEETPDPEASLARLRELCGGDAEPVAGIGDAALRCMSQLFAFHGDRQVTVLAGGFFGKQAGQGREIEERVMTTVLTRL